MKSKTLLVIIGIILSTILVGSYVVYKHRIAGAHMPSSNKSACENVDPVSMTKHAQFIDIAKAQYATSSKRIVGRSTDGGIQMNYMQGDKVVLVELGLYGKKGKLEASYLLQDGNVYYIHREETTYDRSLRGQDINPESQKVETQDRNTDELYAGG